MHPYIIPLAAEFSKRANSGIAEGAKAYMKGQFDYYGLLTPLRRSISKAYMKKSLPAYKDLPAIITELWNLPQREFQYFATELAAALRKEWTKDIIKLAEYMIMHKSWWDTVDHIATEITGPYFTLFPQQIKPVTGKWNKSGNIWLQRSSIMFQKAYRHKTDTDVLAAYILRCKDSKEFFVLKAIGWSLREYSKHNPKWVRQFVKANKLAPLSEREALKRII